MTKRKPFSRPDEGGRPASINDQSLVRGNGGELHQHAEKGAAVLTTAHGSPFPTIRAH